MFPPFSERGISSIFENYLSAPAATIASTSPYPAPDEFCSAHLYKSPVSAQTQLGIRTAQTRARHRTRSRNAPPSPPIDSTPADSSNESRTANPATKFPPSQKFACSSNDSPTAAPAAFPQGFSFDCQRPILPQGVLPRQKILECLPPHVARRHPKPMPNQIRAPAPASSPPEAPRPFPAGLRAG